jgi:hypothetical protein
MFLGVILLCAAGTTAQDVNGDNCMAFNSPQTYSTEQICVESIYEVLSSEPMELNFAAGLELANAMCINIAPIKGQSI